MREVYLQAKRLFLLCTIVLLALMLFSCIIYIYQDDAITVDAKKYLETNFSGSFTDGREISLDNSRYNNYRSDNRLFKFYSSALRQDVSVLAHPYYDNNKITGYYYSTNYLFLKYAKDITESAEKMILSDFSDVKILYDFDWMFSDESENYYSKESFLLYNSYTIHKSPKFILIKASEEELSDFEKRIKSVIFTYRIENSIYSELQFFITPSSKTENSIDFNSVTVDDLLTKEYRSKFYKCYVCKINNIEYEEFD